MKTPKLTVSATVFCVLIFSALLAVSAVAETRRVSSASPVADSVEQVLAQAVSSKSPAGGRIRVMCLDQEVVQ